MKVLSIANFKGGCGKTTSAYYLAKLMSLRRVKTLVIDLDPQHNLTDMFTPNSVGATIADVLGGLAPAVPIERAIHPLGQMLTLVPSEDTLANVALGLLSDVVKGRSALRRALRQVDNWYGLVLIDCPPEAGILLANALIASDGVLLPAEPEPPAIAGIRAVADMVGLLRDELERDTPTILGTIATRIDQRTTRHAAGLKQMRSLPAPLWGEIPERNGQLRDQELRLAYEPVTDRIYEWLGVQHAGSA